MRGADSAPAATGNMIWRFFQSRQLIAGRDHRLESLANAHLFEKLRQIEFGGADAQPEPFGYLLIGVALGDVVKELLFSIAQSGQYFCVAFGHQRAADQQANGELGRDIGLSLCTDLRASMSPRPLTPFKT